MDAAFLLMELLKNLTFGKNVVSSTILPIGREELKKRDWKQILPSNHAWKRRLVIPRLRN
jgi:hypothetical protein